MQDSSAEIPQTEPSQTIPPESLAVMAAQAATLRALALQLAENGRQIELLLAQRAARLERRRQALH